MIFDPFQVFGGAILRGISKNCHLTKAWGNLWEIWKSMGNILEIYGKYIGNILEIYGKYVGHIWEIYGKYIYIHTYDYIYIYHRSYMYDTIYIYIL